MSSIMRSRRRRILAGTAMAITGVLAFTACAGADAEPGDEAPAGGGFADMEQVTLKVGTVYGPDSWQSTAVAAYAEAVTEASDGKIAFEFFWGDTLLSAAELPGGLSDGVIDVAAFLPVYTPAEFPIDTWAGGLTTGSDVDVPVAGALMGIAAVAEWGFETDPYMAEIEAAGITPLIPRTLLVADFGILCKDEASTLDAIGGKRIRVGNATATSEVEALGGIPTTVSGPETYSAFQQGVIDCSVTNVPDMQALSLIDVAKNYNFTGLTGWSHAVLGISTSTWDSLPEVAKDALWDANSVYLKALAESYIGLTIEGVELPDLGYSVPDADMQDAIDAADAAAIKSLPERAPASLTDAKASVDLAHDLQASWFDKVTGDLGYSGDAADWVDYVDANGSSVPDLQAWADAVKADIFDGRRPK